MTIVVKGLLLIGRAELVPVDRWLIPQDRL